MASELRWTYERDECWGPDGEPLLCAALLGEQLHLRVRNSRRYGLEVVIAVVGSDDLHAGNEGSAFKVAFDDQALRPLQARVQDSQRLAFVADVRCMLAELNCTRLLRLRARPEGGGVWLQLDAAIDDLMLSRLVEPASQILLSYPRPERQAVAQPATRPVHAPAVQSGSEAVAEFVGAVAPLAGLVLGAKLGRSMFGPSRRD